MPSVLTPLWAIASKDIREAMRDKFVLIIVLFLVAAATTSIVVAAIALSGEVAAFEQGKAALLALGKPVDSIVSPAFYPLKLLRGFVEHVEIVGAVIGILIGFRAAASERGRQTLALILTRPVTQSGFLFGKVLAGISLIAVGLFAVFAVAAVTVHFLSGVGLNPEDVIRLAVVFLAANLYATAFFLLGFTSALWMKSLPNALLTAFTIWLCLVLVAPQIGDTMDPDNQVAGGVFKQLRIDKPQETEILAGFSTYEGIRNGIEVASPTKHFERLSFAVLGIKDTYAGQPLSLILNEKVSDIEWLLGIVAGMGVLLFARRLDPSRLSKE